MFIADMLQRFIITSSEGPRILWEQLKGKKVKTNDGQDVGEIKEVAQNYICLEKGIVNKDKLWIPKYLADAYDGKVLWLIISSEDLAKGHSYTAQPSKEQYTQDFEAFKSTPNGQRAIHLPDLSRTYVRLKKEKILQALAPAMNTSIFEI